ncbi:Brix multi-domain protein [Pyrenophora tritici-repentis]|uniref:Brix domain containing protein n=1 Tax=Pyrenophora tritici-repentis TaxID=45151 RepID=A0A2W1ECK6_9PLEO|nr:Brix multi-domain protein [Pyrenophora tritici-repentis]KAF7566349.1 Brix multi-domain protein [Pyrenophora tritici-repentis]KAI0577464.1 Brix multi-domain protein [Pyrenophora tritici-repentis]KAI0586286.1 Brix multi-domain protein [Pyrenophora tritici-repentis]KAI0615143.1 Brix multi-domain protein [Pyrenophora tritici-repentis]
MARGRGTARKKQSAKDKELAKKPQAGPKSMVIRIGAQEVGKSVSDLVNDVRHCLEPDTAIRLKERRANKLKDYLVMCGPLGVSHLLLFSRSESGNTNLRLCRTPRGPTLHFRVENYSLCKDIIHSMRRPRAGAQDYLVAPLLVMNNFLTTDTQRESMGEKAPPKHLEKLVTDMFQGLFPPIQPHTTPLHSIKRVLLLNREPPSDDTGSVTISLRHYAITTKVTGVPKAIRRLYAAEKLIGSKEKKKSALPNLGKLEDVADYMLDPSAAGYTSASDTEQDTDAEVEVTAPVRQKVLSRREKEKLKAGDETSHARARGSKPRVEKRAVKLVELGPRMKLRLTKVEEDVCGGRILWHEFITKTKAEQQELEKKWAQRNKEKEERRRIQKENVEKKRKEKAAARGENPEEGEGDDDEDEEMDDLDDYDMDDDVWQDAADAGEDGEDEEMEE